MELTDKKYFTRTITDRFLFAIDRIVGNRGAGKVTYQKLGDVIGINSSNITRIRSNPDANAVTVEAIGRLCHNYKVSPYWLITGNGEMYSNDELINAYNNLEGRVDQLEKAVHLVEKALSKVNKSKK
jgi:DNA-binding Xre family transcriptional regulator